jgi:hypothetical protein
MISIRKSSLLSVVLVAAVACQDTRDPSPPADIAVSSTYLAAAVRDLLGPDVAVDSLAGPGNCPGHFDVAPDQVARLARSRVLLRFAFQAHLDAKFKAATDRGLSIAEITTQGSLGLPETYLSTCRQVADVLVSHDLLTREQASTRIEAIEHRVGQSWQAARQDIVRRPDLQRQALVAAHQAGLAEGLGLRVVATFSGRDDPGELQRAARAANGTTDILVIGNVPQGPAAAEKLADALDAQAVMFENFPAEAVRVDAYDEMLRTNVGRVLAAWERSQ